MEIKIEQREGICLITFNTKVFNKPMAIALQRTLDDCAKINVRAIVLKGEGKAFCADQDLAELQIQWARIEKYCRKHYNPIVLEYVL